MIGEFVWFTCFHWGLFVWVFFAHIECGCVRMKTSQPCITQSWLSLPSPPISACSVWWLKQIRLFSLFVWTLAAVTETHVSSLAAEDCWCVHWDSRSTLYHSSVWHILSKKKKEKLCNGNIWSLSVIHVVSFLLCGLQASIRVRRVRTAPALFTSASITKSTSTGRWSWSAWSPPTCCEYWRRNPSLGTIWRFWESVSEPRQESIIRKLILFRLEQLMLNSSRRFACMNGDQLWHWCEH